MLSSISLVSFFYVYIYIYKVNCRLHVNNAITFKWYRQSDISYAAVILLASFLQTSPPFNFHIFIFWFPFHHNHWFHTCSVEGYRESNALVIKTLRSTARLLVKLYLLSIVIIMQTGMDASETVFSKHHMRDVAVLWWWQWSHSESHMELGLDSIW